MIELVLYQYQTCLRTVVIWFNVSLIDAQLGQGQ